MTINLVMFNTVEDLAKLTGLSTDNHSQALWDAGFNLDDWDIGFQTNESVDICPLPFLIPKDFTTIGYNGKYYHMFYHA